MASKVPIFVPVDATNKTGSVEMLNAVQPWVNDANRVWSVGSFTNVTIRRYNKGTVRWPFPWRSKQISFAAVVNDLNGNTDGAFAVVVDGALVTYVQPGTGSLFPRRFYVNNLPIAAGGSLVEVWEPDCSRENPQLDTGLDGAVHTGYVTGAWLPPGTSLRHATADTVIVTVGDSIPSSTNQAPAVFHGMVGQLRLLAQSRGGLVVSLDGGSYTLCGDGPSPAQFASLIQQAVASAGSPSTVYVYFQIGRNDYKYTVFAGSIQSTPTDVRTFLQAVINALPASYKKVVCLCITQSAANEAANSIGFTLQDYRNAEALVTGTNVTIIDGTTFGIIPSGVGADLYDGIHELAPVLGNGVPKNLAGMRASVGLP